ncbi:MAG: hypothetical protein AMXMBFR33_15120 [Candidatus Xenobia bacterium]
MRGLSWMDFSPARGGETERARRYGSRHNAPSCERNWHGGQRGPDLRLMLADRLGQLFARLAGRQESHQGGEECPRLSWLEGLCPRGQGSHATMQGPSKPASAKCPPSERPTPAPPVAGPAERPPVTPPAERPTPAPPVAGPAERPPVTPPAERPTPAPPVAGPAERPPVTPPAERPTPAPPVAGPAEPGPIVPDSTPASLDQQYRANVVRAAEEAGDGWAFESSPTPRLLGPSDSWQMGTRELDGQQHSVLELKPGADPTRAVQDLFVNRQNYAFDCATAVRAVGLKAELDTVGADTFSQSHSDLFLFGHYDSVDGNQDSGAWRISAGPSVDYGAGPELGAFDPTSDRLQPGELRYFENPGDTTSENQGWNVIYLGQDAWGQDRFWRTGGEFTGGIEGQYLSDLRGTPDLDQLSAA